MNEELHKKFNEEIERHRRALLFHARQSQWGDFKVNAEQLFDFIESTEIKEFERRFYRIFKTVLGILTLMIIAIVKLNPEVYPEFSGLQGNLIVLAIAGCCFEVFFFYNFRMYVKGKALYYLKRRNQFTHNIALDFSEITVPASADARSTAPLAMDTRDRETSSIGVSAGV